MAIADGLICQVYPVAGESVVKNIVDNSTFSGTGTPTLVDEGAEKAWAVAAGVLLESAIPSKLPAGNVAGSGVTIAIRFKPTANGSGADFLSILGVKPDSTSVDTGVRISRAGNGIFRGRSEHQLNTQLSGFNLNTVYTLVYKIAPGPVAASDFGKLWRNMIGRVGTAADASSSGSDYTINRTLNRAFVNCQSGVAYTLLDFAYWDRELSDAECASVADNYRGVMPAPAAGTTPTGTVTIGTITPNSTDASVPFTYSAADQTGFEYRINGGTAVTGTTSPQVLTGLTPSTAYTIEVRAINATGAGAWSAVGNFTTLTPQVPQGTVTLGIITAGQTTASVPFTYSLADQTGFEYRLNGGTVVTGTVSPQNLTGLTAATAYTIEIRATNGTGAGTWSAVGNFTTAAAPQVPQGTFSVGTISVTETTSSVPYTYSASDQTGIEYRINSGTAITASASPQSVTGLTANTAYTIQFRAINATGNGAWSTAVNFTTAAAAGVGTFTSEPLYRLVDGVLMANKTFTYYRLYSEAGALVVNKTSLTSNAAGIVSFTDAAVVAGTKYKSDWLTVDGEFCMPSKAAT